ncbi:MAG: hypothetical protein U0R70_14685 [Solirubrobacteraceae bacterium]
MPSDALTKELERSVGIVRAELDVLGAQQARGEPIDLPRFERVVKSICHLVRAHAPATAPSQPDAEPEPSEPSEFTRHLRERHEATRGNAA